jgi:GTPase SAR1 family protein
MQELPSPPLLPFFCFILVQSNSWFCNTPLLPLPLQVTYKNLDRWYAELQEHCRGIPTFLVANKIDVNYAVTEKV